MPTTFNVVSLGQYAIIDPTEGSQGETTGTTAENAAALVGQTFGSETDPLLKNFKTFSPGDAPTYNTNVPTAVYNQGSLGENFKIDGGNNQEFDAITVYNATVTYVDGTTANILANIIQDVNGNTYWAPNTTQNANQDAMEAKPIRSLTLDSINNAAAGGLTANRDAWEFQVCFTGGTLIQTQDGDVAVENLSPGDMVRTRDNGLQPIRWIGSRRLSVEELMAAPNLRPIRIRAGALGHNTPVTDLIVSPQHRMLLRSSIVSRMFGADEVLVAAKQLLEIDGVEIVEASEPVQYFHFIFDQHEIVYANGAETESLYLGQQALKSLGSKAREEIFTLFPELQDIDTDNLLPAARPLVPGRMGRKLAHRHSINEKALVV